MTEHSNVSIRYRNPFMKAISSTEDPCPIGSYFLPNIEHRRHPEDINVQRILSNALPSVGPTSEAEGHILGPLVVGVGVEVVWVWVQFWVEMSHQDIAYDPEALRCAVAEVLVVLGYRGRNVLQRCGAGVPVGSL